MKITTKSKKQDYWKCKKCGDEIYWNTDKKMIFCKCKAMGVDGCEFYVRLIGKKTDYSQVMRNKKNPSLSLFALLFQFMKP